MLALLESIDPEIFSTFILFSGLSVTLIVLLYSFSVHSMKGIWDLSIGFILMSVGISLLQYQSPEVWRLSSLVSGALGILGFVFIAVMINRLLEIKPPVYFYLLLIVISSSALFFFIFLKDFTAVRKITFHFSIIVLAGYCSYILVKGVAKRKYSDFNIFSFLFVAIILFHVLLILNVIFNEWYINEHGSDTISPLQMLGYLFFQILVSFVFMNVSINMQYSKLKETISELGKANKDKQMIISIISHDLRSPLVSAVRIMEHMLRHKDQDTKNFYRYIGEIRNLNIKFIDQLENLLDWGKKQQGLFELDIVGFELVDLVNSIIDFYRITADHKEIGISVSIPPEIIIRADKRSIEIILRNLIGNSLKFTDPGGTIEVVAELKGSTVELKVIDSGIGISAEKISKLLGDGTVISSEGTYHEGGTGLGLSLCKDILKMNNWGFDIISNHNKGTEVKLSLFSVIPDQKGKLQN